MPREKLTLHELLVKARNRIEDHWTRGVMIGIDNRMCILGAMGIAAFDKVPSDTVTIIDRLNVYFTPREVDQLRYMVKSLPSVLPHGNPFCALVHFNDDPSTIEKDVLNLLDKLIAGTAPEPESLELKVPEEDRELAAS